MKYQYLQQMEKQFVIPLETFAQTDIEKAQKLKVKYKNTKTTFDVTAHKLSKAESSGSKDNDQSKINAAKQKKDVALQQLTSLRSEIKTEINNLEQKKNVDLLGQIEKFWTSFNQYVQSQNDLMNNMGDMYGAGNYNEVNMKQEMIQSQFEEYDANEGNHGNEGNEDVTGDQYNPFQQDIESKQVLMENGNQELIQQSDDVKDDEYNDQNENKTINEDGYDPFDERFLPNSQTEL